MSNSDFEDRLQRIKANAGQQSGVPASELGKRGIRFGRLTLGALAMAAGGQMIKIANVNYDSIRDQYGAPAAAGLGLGSFALLILGVVLVIRAVVPARGTSASEATPSYQTSQSRPQAQTSAGARMFFSLLGLALGALACLYMYLANAGRQLGVTGQVDTETARAMATGSTVAAALLVALGFFIGFIGLFVRRLPMRRVPVFLLLGTMLLYTSFQTLGIHPSNWPTFMAQFIEAFQN